MSAILFMGAGPLPFENTRRFSAPGGRTWQLIRPLLKDGHRVLLLALYPRDSEPVPAGAASPEKGLTCRPITRDTLRAPGALPSLLGEFRPDALVATGAESCCIAAGASGELPFWADVFGDLLAEAQAKAARCEDDHWVASFWSRFRPVLLRGDRFSAVSTPQKYALLGELATQGRVNAANAGTELVHVVHSAVPGIPYRRESRAVRGSKVGEGDFVVLWSGGYNTWADTETLFLGLEYAMERNPAVKFVSTGGEIRDHDEVTYPRFLDRIRGSPHRERYVMEGWVPRERVKDYFLDADVGINVDRFLYEGVLGCRTRLLDWAAAGLPVLTTVLCELTVTLDREGLVTAFPIGDPAALGKSILSLAGNRGSLRAMGQRFREYVFSRFTYEATTGPIRQWAAAPFVVDHRTSMDSLSPLRFDESPEELKAKLDELRALKASRAYRLFLALTGGAARSGRRGMIR
ncbi:MAG: glycosyltransferase family 4 protein [Chlamydiota bacterium]